MVRQIKMKTMKVTPGTAIWNLRLETGKGFEFLNKAFTIVMPGLPPLNEKKKSISQST